MEIPPDGDAPQGHLRDVVIGQQWARAEEAERRHRLGQGGAPSPLRDVAYDQTKGETSLYRFVESPADRLIGTFIENFDGIDRVGRAKIRADLRMSDFYTMLTFARRRTLLTMRTRDPALAREGVSALTTIDVERVDHRDVIVATALLAFALQKVNADVVSTLSEAADRSTPGTAEILRRFAAEPVPSLKPWGSREVETSEGVVLFVDWGHAYEPTIDLPQTSLEIAKIIESDDRYRVTDIGLGSELPAVWLKRPGFVIAPAIGRIKGCVDIRSALRPSLHGAPFEGLLVFVFEAGRRRDAKRLAATGEITGAPGRQSIGVARGVLCCIVIASSFADEEPSVERIGALERFRAALGGALERASSS